MLTVPLVVVESVESVESVGCGVCCPVVFSGFRVVVCVVVVGASVVAVIDIGLGVPTVVSVPVVEETGGKVVVSDGCGVTPVDVVETGAGVIIFVVVISEFVVVLGHSPIVH